ncbi:hypothetical protein OI18_10040 [Flavihumibacter solisilvae]|uniref:von Willebrand factor type A n=1 Tax=Flavihumibacter solisilvae TaxID=1349421 RepID=A0A0C1LHL2_9BACT|nr:hypothetical protein OI18_10040 [Flavihumibacter solisilvae]
MVSPAKPVEKKAVSQATVAAPGTNPHKEIAMTAEPSKIQVAILLDVSNSMDGLIEQAKAQLWNMVSVLGKAKCDGQAPRVELALYEYGRLTNKVGKGYVEQISPFTTDLDLVSRNLFRLNTNGGDEYCGQVMLTSLSELPWSGGNNNYKVIFIAGNEDFLQGSIPFTKACVLAKQKGVIVNTIYCGDRMQGIREHWNLGSECGNGSYTFINSDARIQDIATPYDQPLIELNEKLNKTYVGYGRKAAEGKAMQEQVDQANYKVHSSVAVKRISVKGKKELYRNDSWDLVDAEAANPGFVTTVKPGDLPDTLKGKSPEEIKKYIHTLSADRDRIQKEIAALSVKREAFLTQARSENSSNTDQTLETEVEKIIRQQAARFNMKLDK